MPVVHNSDSTSESPGELLKIPMLRPHPRESILESLARGRGWGWGVRSGGAQASIIIFKFYVSLVGAHV